MTRILALMLVASGMAAGRQLTGPLTADSIDKVEWTAASDAAASGRSSAASSAANSTDLQPGGKPPIEHTYRNAYGTRFECSSTCMLLLGVHVVLVVGGLLLLSVIPVRFATNEKLEAPFVLWFGPPKKKRKRKPVEEETEEAQSESLWRRALTWLAQTTSRFFVATPARDVDMRYRFHADMLAASARAVKSYESIAVAMDDLEGKSLSPPQSYASIAVSTDDLEVKTPRPPETDESAAAAVDELEVKPPPPFHTDGSEARATGEFKVHSPSSHRLTRPSGRSSIFTAPPSPSSMLKIRQGNTRFASDASSVGADAISRRTSSASYGAVETKEDFVRSSSRRQSMAVRTERRVILAQEDVSYENLGDDEIRMYEYLEFVRELLDGLAIKKVCQKSGRVVSRTLYITPDMTTVFWNSVGTFKRLRSKSSIQTHGIEQVLKGIHGSANVTARSTPERDALCVSIQCSDGKWLVLEAKTEAARQRLFLGFYRLAQEKLEQEVEPVETTIPEDREAEDAEALMEEQEHQVQQSETVLASEQQQKALSTEVTIKGEEKLGLLDEEEVVAVAEQLDYEEKAPPPLLDESLLLQHELLSIAESYREESSDGDQQQGGDSQRDQGQQGEHDQNDEEGFQGSPRVENRAIEEKRRKELLHEQEDEEHKATEEEGMTEEPPFQEPEEEARKGGDPDDDPEMSRE